MSFNTKAGMRDDMTMTNMTDSQPALDNKNATIGPSMMPPMLPMPPILYYSTMINAIK